MSDRIPAQKSYSAWLIKMYRYQNIYLHGVMSGGGVKDNPTKSRDASRAKNYSLLVAICACRRCISGQSGAWGGGWGEGGVVLM